MYILHIEWHVWFNRVPFKSMTDKEWRRYPKFPFSFFSIMISFLKIKISAPERMEGISQ